MPAISSGSATRPSGITLSACFKICSLVVNADAIGLLFDGTFESVNSDWDFDPKTTRTIHVDTRYMLWVMEYVDGATNLIEEMTIVK